MFDAEWRGKTEEKRKEQKTRLQPPDHRPISRALTALVNSMQGLAC